MRRSAGKRLCRKRIYSARRPDLSRGREWGGRVILGTGIDIIEIGRIKTAMGRRPFAARVFTERERAYCESRGVQRFASYAARFAAKEAVMKAFGTGLSAGSWQDVEVLTNDAGRPVIRLSGYFGDLAGRRGVTELFLSMSHAREYAAAQVILWGGSKE